MESRTSEKCYPYIISLIVTVGYIICLCCGVPCKIEKNILSSGITAGAIFAGFDATHKSLLMCFNSKMFKRIKSLDYYDDLMSYMNQNLQWSLLFVLLSFIMQMLYEYDESTWFISNILSPLWVFLLIVMLLSFYRVNSIFADLLWLEKNN